MTTQERVTLALAVLVLAAAAALVWLVRTGDPPVAGVTTAESDRAVVASPSVRDEVVSVAEEATERVYSYSWQSLTQDKVAARALLTGDMLAQYDRTMAGVVTSSVRDQTVVQARVVGAGLVTATRSDARVLVFVNQSTAGADLDEPELDLDRVLVTLVRTGGEWKVSELDAL